jgi:hypothetical protein
VLGKVHYAGAWNDGGRSDERGINALATGPGTTYETIFALPCSWDVFVLALAAITFARYVTRIAIFAGIRQGSPQFYPRKAVQL